MHDAYVAGLFDGEGTVRIDRYWVKNAKTPYMRYQLRVSLGMCHAPTVKALYDTFGGAITRFDKHYVRNDANRIQYHWHHWSSHAANFCRRIRPYAITKAEQLDHAIKFQDHMVEYDPVIRKNLKHGGLHALPNKDDIIAFREFTWNEMKRLNWVGFDVSTEELRRKSDCNGPILT